MFVVDQIDTPASNAGLTVVMDVSVSRKMSKERPHVLGVCDVVNLTKEEKIDLYPHEKAVQYFKGPTEQIDYSTAKITVVKQPRHGKLIPSGSVENEWDQVQYQPNQGYLGKEEIVLQVEGNEHVVRVHYFLAVTDDRDVTFNPSCTAFTWKISSSLPTGTDDFTHWQTSASLSAMLANASGSLTNFSDLADSAVGETKGQGTTAPITFAVHTSCSHKTST